MTDDPPVFEDPPVTEDAVAEESGPEERGGRTVPAGAFVVAVMAAAVLGILAVVALTVGGDDDSTASSSAGSGSRELDDVQVAAGRFAERFLTFRDGELDAWREDIEALTTAGFAREVDEVEDGLRRLIAEAELDARAEVTAIFTGEIERGAVDVIVIYDRQLTSAEGARDETDRYMQLALLRVDGQWLVDNVIDIATAGGAGASPASPATGSTAPTTTEAPG